MSPNIKVKQESCQLLHHTLMGDWRQDSRTVLCTFDMSRRLADIINFSNLVSIGQGVIGTSQYYCKYVENGRYEKVCELEIF
jgi:hypothetical protein